MIAKKEREREKRSNGIKKKQVLLKSVFPGESFFYSRDYFCQLRDSQCSHSMHTLSVFYFVVFNPLIFLVSANFLFFSVSLSIKD